MPHTSLELLTFHKSLLTKAAPSIEAQCQKGDSGVLYSTSYYLHGMLSAIEGSNDAELLDEVIMRCSDMIGSTIETTVGGKTYRVWQYEDDKPDKTRYLRLTDKGMPNQLSTFQAASAIARCAAIINRHPEWRYEFADDAAAFCDHVWHNVVSLYFHPQSGAYKGKIHPSWYNGAWYDMIPWTAINCAYLHQATADKERRELCSSLVSQCMAQFKAKLKPVPFVPTGTGYIWAVGDIKEKRNTTGILDTSHANREPMMLVACHEAGLLPLSDVGMLVQTLMGLIWNKSVELPAFANYIHGSNEPYNGLAPWNNGVVCYGWVLLGRYSPLVRQIMDRVFELIDTEPDDPQAGPSQFMHKDIARIAMSGHILRNRVPMGTAVVSSDFLEAV